AEADDAERPPRLRHGDLTPAEAEGIDPDTEDVVDGAGAIGARDHGIIGDPAPDRARRDLDAMHEPRHPEADLDGGQGGDRAEEQQREWGEEPQSRSGRGAIHRGARDATRRASTESTGARLASTGRARRRGGTGSSRRR